LLPGAASLTLAILCSAAAADPQKIARHATYPTFTHKRGYGTFEQKGV
jgi:hypothetical protein